MKITFATLALSLFGSTLAAPAAQATEPNSYPVSVGNLSLKHLIESDTYDFTFHATRRSPTGEPIESVICHTAWNKNGPYPSASAPESCAYIYSFYFAEGAANVESYQLTLIDENGQEASGLIATGPKYQCGPYEGDIGNIDTECRSTNGGEFYLRA
ncbi:hypothetical protein BJX66DRAFT_40573 [Aspergillus keveii]|uniref:AA1-like domain-containing protein n=1 Tax=Aspergillus keveii TaxID=714993 RepID=A0ABR4FSW4_9EURO